MFVPSLIECIFLLMIVICIPFVQIEWMTTEYISGQYNSRWLMLHMYIHVLCSFVLFVARTMMNTFMRFRWGWKLDVSLILVDHRCRDRCWFCTDMSVVDFERTCALQLLILHGHVPFSLTICPTDHTIIKTYEGSSEDVLTQYWPLDWHQIQKIPTRRCVNTTRINITWGGWMSRFSPSWPRDN